MFLYTTRMCSIAVQNTFSSVTATTTSVTTVAAVITISPPPHNLDPVGRIEAALPINTAITTAKMPTSNTLQIIS